MLGKKILVVDDDETIRTFLKILLESHGFEVVTVSNGFEALEMVKNVDQIVTDMNMPGLNGRDVAYYARINNFKGRITLCYNPDGKDEEKANADGLFDGVFVKPIASSDLLAALTS